MLSRFLSDKSECPCEKLGPNPHVFFGMRSSIYFIISRGSESVSLRFVIWLRRLRIAEEGAPAW